MNDGTWVVELKDERLDEVSGATVGHRNDDVIEFDLLDATFLVDDLQAVHDWATEHEGIRNDNSERDSANEVDADGAQVDDMGRNECKKTDKVSA